MMTKIIISIFIISSYVLLISTEGLFEIVWQNKLDYCSDIYFFWECQKNYKRPLQAECEWYQLCLEGRYASKRCPSDGTGLRQMFNPYTNNCTDNVKLSIEGKCQSYKQCLLIESVSPFGKWTEMSCESGLHFNQESQTCIDSRNSTCGKCPIGFTGKNCECKFLRFWL